MKKKELEKLEKELGSKPVLVWDKLSETEKKEVETVARDYMAFLGAAKTERESVREIVARVEKGGFKPAAGRSKAAKVFSTRMGKVAAVSVIGKKPITDGIRLIVSHIDAPRLDLKPRPLYEEIELVFLKTHYYGGIKKYQWFSRPLALHGFVARDDGTTFDVVIGEKPEDPVFTIADLLPHLARKAQYDKKLPDAFQAEKMNILIGSLPLGDAEVKSRFKLAVLDYLHKEWGIKEDDFISAEFQLVPVGLAREVGLDRSMIGAYGQDDRASAYSSLAAISGVQTPEYTGMALFVDREEIGSEGATGAQSRFFEAFVCELMEKAGIEPTSSNMRQALMNTRALSADVNGALDPDYQEVHEKMNAARLGYGPCVTKYTGSGGKYGASEASAEFLGWLRGVFKKENIVWQPALLGKTDEGGGGTVAMFLAKYGMEIVDCGPSLLAMHSPFEISAKPDIYMTVKAFRAFYQAK